MSRVMEKLLATAGVSEKGITTGEPAAPIRRTWGEVHHRARGMAAALRAAGVARGDAVALLAGDPEIIAPGVQAVWLAGGSITMLHQPTARTDLATWADDTVRVLAMIGARRVLLGPPFEPIADVLRDHGVTVSGFDGLDDDAPDFTPVPLGEDDTALLQLTSGSTAEPKAVRITHGNLWANFQAMEIAAGLVPETDVMVSWLPLFHDMGMVGFLIVPMMLGIELVKVTPVEFLGGPLTWPELITRYGGTVTAAPNFAYAIIGRRLAHVADGTYDLSTLRLALNGAEPIDPAAIRTFCDAAERFGMSPGAVFCAYGMAEATLGVAFAPLGRGMVVDHIDPDDLELRHRATPVAADRPDARAFPLLGPPVPGIEVAVTGEDGEPLGEREVGLLRLRGASISPGYLTMDGPVATKDADGWLDTGDEGYLVGGEVVVCGRRKDVIIMGGRNIYPTDVERAAAEVEGVRAGNTAAVRLDDHAGRDRFAVAVESRQADDPEAARRIGDEVTSRVTAQVGARPYVVRVLPPGSLPKTPSGKLRRAALRRHLLDAAG
ncbi:MAG TPA: fatty acyl-AMP ligase [Streptosporangiaceae bacterium]